jgi:hypothetical protein
MQQALVYLRKIGAGKIARVRGAIEGRRGR